MLALAGMPEKQFSLATIEEKLTEPAAIEKIIPVAEEHIDTFLRVKFPAAMPMLAMFISDKLVADMKGIFMTELKELFPVLIRQYLSNVTHGLSIGNLIASHLNNLSLEMVTPLIKRQLQVVSLACAATGFLCGCISLLMASIA